MEKTLKDWQSVGRADDSAGALTCVMTARTPGARFGVHRDVTDAPARHRALHQSRGGKAGKGCSRLECDAVAKYAFELSTSSAPVQRG
jgi:hypothetical protein